MTAGTIVATLTGATAFVTAVTALYHAVTAKQQVKAVTPPSGPVPAGGGSSAPASPPPLP